MSERAFRFLPGDEVLYVFAMPGPDTYPVQIAADDGGDSVTILEGAGAYGSGPRTVERVVPRSKIAWLRGSVVSQRFAESRR